MIKYCHKCGRRYTEYQVKGLGPYKESTRTLCAECKAERDRPMIPITPDQVRKVWSYPEY